LIKFYVFTHFLRSDVASTNDAFVSLSSRSWWSDVATSDNTFASLSSFWWSNVTSSVEWLNFNRVLIIIIFFNFNLRLSCVHGFNFQFFILKNKRSKWNKWFLEFFILFLFLFCRIFINHLLSKFFKSFEASVNCVREVLNLFNIEINHFNKMFLIFFVTFHIQERHDQNQSFD
jgi:hypothetical protein